MDKQRIINEYVRAINIACGRNDMTPSHYTKTGAMDMGKLVGKAMGITMGIELMLDSMNMKFVYNEDCEIIDIVDR